MLANQRKMMTDKFSPLKLNLLSFKNLPPKKNLKLSPLFKRRKPQKNPGESNSQKCCHFWRKKRHLKSENFLKCILPEATHSFLSQIGAKKMVCVEISARKFQ